MKLDHFTAWVQAVLSAIYLIATFAVIIIYELGGSRLTSQGQEKTFDSMVSWMTGGALIVLYFWLQRAKAQSSESTTITTPPPTGDSNETSTTISTTSSSRP